jgi:hypothetical protein
MAGAAITPDCFLIPVDAGQSARDCQKLSEPELPPLAAVGHVLEQVKDNGEQAGTGNSIGPRNRRRNGKFHIQVFGRPYEKTAAPPFTLVDKRVASHESVQSREVILAGPRPRA